MERKADVSYRNLQDIVQRIEKVRTDISHRLEIEETATEITNILMSTSLSLSEKIRSCLLLILNYINADRGSLMLVNTVDEEELVVVEAVSNGESNTSIIGKRQKMSDSISSWVVKNKELLLIEDIRKDSRFNSEMSSRFRINYESNSLLSLPLIDQQNKVIGVLNLTDKKGRNVFTRRDMYAAVIFADRITPTISYSRLNEQLKRKNEKLQELQRMKSDLTNMVVHDIKGHLGEIISNIDLLTSYKRLAPNYKECLDAAMEGCENLLRLVLNLLDISKMEERKIILKLREFDIISVIKGVISKVKTLAARKNIRISLAADEVGYNIIGDRGMIERVMDNLLLNAITYSRPDTTIDVSVSQDRIYTYISTSDKGEGIPPELQKKIFEKFEQGGREKGRYSTGLGLTFCKMAIEEHKGRIWVTSEEGKGSTFTFSLPIIPSPTEEPMRLREENPSAS